MGPALRLTSPPPPPPQAKPASTVRYISPVILLLKTIIMILLGRTIIMILLLRIIVINCDDCNDFSSFQLRKMLVRSIMAG